MRRLTIRFFARNQIHFTVQTCAGWRRAGVDATATPATCFLQNTLGGIYKILYVLKKKKIK